MCDATGGRERRRDWLRDLRTFGLLPRLPVVEPSMTTATQTLTEFLLARIAEDQSRAESIRTVTYLPRWRTSSGGEVLESPVEIPDLRARLLAECEAKRRIVKRYVDTSYLEPVPSNAYDLALFHVMNDLAAVYSDHPDYRDEWRP